MRSVESAVLARAVAIILVVANHAEFGVSLHGGLNALLVVSGLSLAQFGFLGTTGDSVRAMARIGLRLAIPSLLLAFVWQVGVDQISLPELGFYSNWLYKSRVALFPIWYVQALSQMLVVLAAFFVASDMGARIARHPVFWGALLYAASCGVAYLSYNTWETSYYADKLPHLILWNFAYGWLIWALRGSLPSFASRLLLTLVLGVSIAVLFLSVDANNGETRAMLMPIVVLPLIWLDRIRLPAVLSRFVIVASQSTLFIFLFHYYAFWTIWRIGRLIGFEEQAINPYMRLVAGVIGPMVLWALCTAMLRVYHRGYRLWPFSLARETVFARLQPETTMRGGGGAKTTDSAAGKADWHKPAQASRRLNGS